jgi:hypothetical protein
MTAGVITPINIQTYNMISDEFNTMVIDIQIFPLATINTINFSKNRNTIHSNVSGRTHILLRYRFLHHDIYYRSMHHDFEQKYHVKMYYQIQPSPADVDNWHR